MFKQLLKQPNLDELVGAIAHNLHGQGFELMPPNKERNEYEQYCLRKELPDSRINVGIDPSGASKDEPQLYRVGLEFEFTMPADVREAGSVNHMFPNWNQMILFFRNNNSIYHGREINTARREVENGLARANYHVSFRKDRMSQGFMTTVLQEVIKYTTDYIETHLRMAEGTRNLEYKKS